MVKKHRKNKKSFLGRPIWRNSTKTLKVAPLRYYQPDNLQDIEEMVQEGLEQQITVRAVGAGHSFSKVPLAKGILIDMHKIDSLKQYSATTTKGHYYEVGGGISINSLNKRLDKLGLSMPTMGGIDHQSLAGAVSTGTHGSSLHFGAMSNMVKSITMVSCDLDYPKQVKTYRIEPSNGITNTGNKRDSYSLIQDDEIFNSALVCFGMFGIIFSYVLQVEESFYLSEKKEVGSWSEIRRKLKDKLFLNFESVSVQINPYVHKQKQNALWITHNRHDASNNKIDSRHFKPGILGWTKRKWRSIQYEIVNRFPYLLWFIVIRLNIWPKYVPKFLNTAVKSQKDDLYFDKSFKVMFQGLDYVKERAIDCEFAVTMKDDHYLEVLDELIVYLQKLSKEYSFHITSPIGLRFVKKNDAYLTPEYNEDVCYIDTPILLHIYGRDTIIGLIQKFMMAKKAKAHWGKMNNKLDKEYVALLYPALEKFKIHALKFNAQSIFSNEFTKRVLGI